MAVPKRGGCPSRRQTSGARHSILRLARKLVLDGLEKFFPRHVACLDLGETEDMVDNLLFVNRSAQFGQRLVVVTVEIPNLLFLTRERPRPSDEGLRHLL